MTSGTEPLEFGRTILHRASAGAQKKVVRQSQRNLVEKEEKCEYETFVTDLCACELGLAEMTSNVEKKKTRRSRPLSQVSVDSGVLEPAEPIGCSC